MFTISSLSHALTIGHLYQFFKRVVGPPIFHHIHQLPQNQRGSSGIDLFGQLRVNLTCEYILWMSQVSNKYSSSHLPYAVPILHQIHQLPQNQRMSSGIDLLAPLTVILTCEHILWMSLSNIFIISLTLFRALLHLEAIMSDASNDNTLNNKGDFLAVGDKVSIFLCYPFPLLL